MMKEYYDIREVCELLGCTSRTLRHYEDKGIIESVRSDSGRRQYTDAQVALIRNVLVLRSLNLPIPVISELQREGGDLKEAILSRRAEILASIRTKLREIDLLNDALTAIDAGEDIFSRGEKAPQADHDTLAAVCTRAVIEGNTDLLYRHLSPKLIEYMPREVYESVRADTLAPLGRFVGYGKLERDGGHVNIFYQYVCFEKLGLVIKLVLHCGMIDGFWLHYFELEGGRK